MQGTSVKSEMQGERACALTYVETLRAVMGVGRTPASFYRRARSTLRWSRTASPGIIAHFGRRDTYICVGPVER